MFLGSYTKIGFLKDILCYQGFDQDYRSILEHYKTKKHDLGASGTYEVESASQESLLQNS